MSSRNLDPTLYVDPAVYARERERIFWRSWQLLGPAEPVSEAGGYVAADIAGAGAIVVRADDGELRGFRNVCTHRGAQLLEVGTGTCAAIRCPYHQWLFGLDGTLRRMPHYGADDSFDAAEWPLAPIAVEVWRGLLFAAIEPSEPLHDALGDLVTVLTDEPIESYRMAATHRMVFDANWKIYTDNFIEGYHIPGIHPRFYAAIQFDEFRTTAMDNLVHMTAPPRPGLFYRGTWLWTWPNMTLSLFDGGINTSRINPLAHDRTELLYHYYFADLAAAGEEARRRSIDGSIAVVEEDFSICESTHRNYATGGYRPGPLSPRHEQGVAWFQRRVVEALA